MATFFIVSDVHGFYEEMMESLNNAGFDINNKGHIFVSLGDLLDRGNQAKECLEFVNNLPADRKILIRGNHEDLMEEAICRKYFMSHDHHNRTNNTAYQLTGLDPQTAHEGDILNAMKDNQQWNTYINSCIDYYETDKYIFVHGWIPIKMEIVEEEQYKDLPNAYKPIQRAYNENWRISDVADWEEARWLNGMELWAEGIKEPGKTIYCGHWSTSYGHKNIHHEDIPQDPEDYYLLYLALAHDQKKINDYIKKSYLPFRDEGIVAIDTSTVVSHFVNCVKLSRMKAIE